MSCTTTSKFLSEKDYSSLASETPRSSFDTNRSAGSATKDSLIRRIGRGIKKHAKEHHESVNGAFYAYYGMPIQGQRPAAEVAKQSN
ncbi:hypothetical protein ONS95_008472 [Cadophora gregata]|uniref:uncharacterized protein n=1 Tax=Cadophora gregata TaxID=51156 RepID=UPI0026DB055A|nr:uncharacterized protein ONS95_008472 [Cadophora gregata]KAK0100133.1 hypothetical protein ONS95_008472 [Cadophora gregata]KAK0114928.1 hypothetical protein ONS96_013402 [Cadophora gregata f. sp. sojae]